MKTRILATEAGEGLPNPSLAGKTAKIGLAERNSGIREERFTRRKWVAINRILGMRRAERLNVVANERSTLAAFAKAHGISRQRLNYLLRHPLGFEAARRIEIEWDLPPGILESDAMREALRNDLLALDLGISTSGDA